MSPTYKEETQHVQFQRFLFLCCSQVAGAYSFYFVVINECTYFVGIKCNQVISHMLVSRRTKYKYCIHWLNMDCSSD